MSRPLLPFPTPLGIEIKFKGIVHMTLKDVIEILVRFDVKHVDPLSKDGKDLYNGYARFDEKKGQILINKKKSKGLFWGIRKTIIHELEHANRFIKGFKNCYNEISVMKETNRIIKEVYKIQDIQMKYRKIDQEQVEDMMEIFLQINKNNEGIVCTTKKCMYHSFWGNGCSLKKIYLYNGICPHYKEGDTPSIREDIPVKKMFNKINKRKVSRFK